MQDDVVTGFRLSPQQKRLWSWQQAGQPRPYRALCAVLMEGDLCLDGLRQALCAVVAQQEIVRTLFRSLPGMNHPLQVIAEELAPAIGVYDLSGLTPQAQEGQVALLYQEMGHLAFNLERGPILHAWIARLSPLKHVLLLALPALCADSLALQNLVRQVAQAYAIHIQAGNPGAAAPAPPQYADVAEVLNDFLESEEMQSGRDYWRRQTIPDPSMLRLPVEKRPAGAVAFEPQAFSLAVDDDLLAGLEALAAGYTVSVSALLLACWQALLWRLGQQPDVLVGVAYDGRSFAGLEEAIGLFARYLPLGLRLEGQVSFATLVTQVHRAVTEMAEWQEFFAWEPLQEKEDTGPAVFPYCYEYQVWPAPYTAGPVSFTITKRQACIDRFKVKLSCKRESAGPLLATFDYDASLFCAGDVERLAGQFQALLAGVVREPQAALGDLPIVGEAERQQLLQAFNATRRDYAHDKCLHQLFAEQARRMPDRIALIFEEQHLTYASLAARANELAHHLRLLGVAPETRVALCLPRSLEMVVAVLGVLQAGGAYVPLDPSYPAERQAFMLADSGTKVLLTISDFRFPILDLSGAENPKLVCLDTSWPAVAQQAETSLDNLSTPENLAYVIYTSGSTGKPKGVLVEHRSPINLLAGLNHAVYAGQEAPLRASLNAPLVFDAAMQQLVLLLAGHTLCIVPEAVRTDGEALLAYLQRQAVEALDCTPSQLKLLLAAGLLEGAGPALVLVAGEAIDPATWSALAQAPMTFFNIYGPTECTVDATAYLIRPGDEKPTIGRPLANYEVYILDGRAGLLPIGSVGELHIGGPGLARGYLNRPGLTAERFIPNPFCRDVPTERLYKTGDLARFRPDGNIEFIGRLDHQVKVRGNRIELGEIEAVLEQHPAVRQAVVLAREDAPGDKRLVAYITTRDEGRKTEDGSLAAVLRPSSSVELREYLKARLPDYMLPAAFVLLERLPLTPGGKVDRRALPAPTPSLVSSPHRGEGREGVAPRTAIEEVVAGIWADIFGLAQVGVNDNFFELGGHSLLATQVVTRLRRVFQIELPLRHLFEKPTIAALAACIQNVRQAGESAAVPPLKPVARDKPLPLSFAQQRLWFFHHLLPGSPLYHIPLAIRLRGPLNAPLLEQSFKEMARRHEVLRTNLRLEDGQPGQVIQPIYDLRFTIYDLSDIPIENRQSSIENLMREEARRPFDLAQDPLLRVTLLKVAEAEHILLVTMHHIVADGWSMAIAMRELSAVYTALARNEGTEGTKGTGMSSLSSISALPELPIQYADFAAWQQSWLPGETWSRQLAYWQEKLAGLPLLALPTDYPRPAVQRFRGADHALALPQALSEALRKLSQREGASLFMTLTAAFLALLHHYSGQEDVVVGTDVANRNWAETEGLIGFFVNQLALRADLSGDPTFRQLLARVRAVALAAYDHQELPFEQLVKALQPERDLGRAPLFQVKLLLDQAPVEALQLPGLSLEYLESSTETAKFDLTMQLRETAGGLRGWINYDTDLFSPATISQMAELYEAVLQRIVAQPESRLSEVQETMDETRGQHKARQRKEREAVNLEKFRQIRRGPASPSRGESRVAQF